MPKEKTHQTIEDKCEVPRWDYDICNPVARPQMKLTKGQTSKLTFLRWQAPRWHCDTCKPDGREFFCGGKFPGETVTFHVCSGVIQVLLTNLNLIRGNLSHPSKLSLALSHVIFWTSENFYCQRGIFIFHLGTCHRKSAQCPAGKEELRWDEMR